MTLPPDPTEMPSASPDPETPEAPGMPPFAARRSFFGIPAWVALLVLALLLLFVLSRNFQDDRTPIEQDVSDFTEKMEKAVQETKLAFAERFAASGMHYVPVAANSILNPEPHPGGKTPRPKGTRVTALERLNDTEDRAIQQWRDLANSKTRSAGVLRRLGITLFLFDRPGGMEAFRQIASLSKAQKPPGKHKAVSHRLQSEDALLSPAPISSADETQMWEAIYGRNPLKQEEVPAIRVRLEHLNLGWFENIAIAQLYDRAGMRGLADRAANDARASADRMMQVTMWEFLLLVGGTLTLLAYGLVQLVNLSQSPRPLLAPSYPEYAVSAPSSEYFYAPPGALPPPVPYYPTAPSVPVKSAQVEEPASPFSYRVRMIAFVIYFGTFLSIGWPLKFLAPIVTHWSDEAVLRLEMVLGISLYIPVVAITLIAFKRLAEGEKGGRLTWKETLAALGLRSDGVSRDLMTAVIGYAMTFPLVVLAGIISSVLFQKFHTPVHPVDVITMLTQNNLDRALILIEAAVAAPIVEEMMFRGLLFQGLREKWGVGMGAVLSAAVFALSHNTLPGGFLTLWTLGFMFAMVYRRNNSILPNILMHAIHNGLVTIMMFTTFSQ